MSGNLSNSLVTTPQQQRDAVRAQLSAADRGYADAVTDRGLRQVTAAACDCCGSGGSYRLDPDVMPGWLMDVVGADTLVYGPEAGYPQVCRVWSYVDWLAAAAELGDRLRLDDSYSPTTTAMTWCETFRKATSNPSARADTYVDVAIWVNGLDRYSIEVWGLSLSRKAAPAVPLRQQCDNDIRDALSRTPRETAGDYYWDEESFAWIFC